MPKIYGNTVGSGGGLPKSFLLETEDGVQLVGVTVGEETVFDATPNDVRVGKVYAGEDGVETGEKVIPSYNTMAGVKVIPKNSEFKLSNLDSRIDYHDYTKLQTIICSFNTNISKSVSTEKVSIDDKVYDVKSTEVISEIVKNHNTKSIDFGITNNLGTPCIIRYLTYKEIL